MRAELLEEPELQFRDGRHVDPRFGLLELGPADGDAAARRHRERLASASSAARRRSTASSSG
jgi:hypothetical protein